MRAAVDPFEQKAKRLAHELHAEAGQLFACVHLKLAEIERTTSGHDRSQFDELRQLLDQAASHLRRIAHELRPTILDGLGLVAACESLAAGVALRYGIKVMVGGSTGGRLFPDTELALYRIVQEALTNATRHGRARMIRVDFRRSRGQVSARIADDGCGFDTEAVAAEAARDGLGLAGMRDRLTDLGGTLQIWSAPGHGTRLICSVPVD
jgi:signal transduction histidine kinase